MNVKVEDVEKNVRRLEIELESAKLDEGLNKAFKKNAARFNIPGFRRGKAPRSLVERYYGVEVLYEDAVNFICPESYDAAVDEHHLEPVDSPDLQIVQLEKGKPFIFTATVTVKPEVVLGRYKEVSAPYGEVVVTDDDVDAELASAAEKNSRLLPVEGRPSATGDMLTISCEGFLDGAPFEGGEITDRTFALGSGGFIPGFEEQLSGRSAGEEFEINVTFPEDYSSEELKGRDAMFKVLISDIKTKELPEIDDEFARDVSEFDTLAEYKEDIRSKLREEKTLQAERAFEDAVIAAVVADAEIDLPKVMVDAQSGRNIKNLEMMLSYQGMTLDKYIMYSGIERADFIKSMTERAEKEVRTQLVIQKIISVENITAEDSEIDEELRERAEKAGSELEAYKTKLPSESLEYTKERIIAKKAVDLMVKSAIKS